MNIVFVKNVVQLNPRKDVDGLTGVGGFFRYPFVDWDAALQTTAHETGHGLKLSTRTDPNDVAGNDHDPGPDPRNQTPLMGRRVGKPRGYWLRQEDWRKANLTAGNDFR